MFKKLKSLVVFSAILLLLAPFTFADDTIHMSPMHWDSQGETYDFGGYSGYGLQLVQAALNTTGNIFYVDSGNSSAVDYSGAGTSKTKPFKTVDYAIGQCTANNGDVIIVMPGHAESYTAADGFDVDVAGVTIIGMGSGTDMPEFTFADTDATVAIGAANATLVNLRFLAGISEVVTGISVEAAGDDALLSDLFFPEPTTSTFEFDKSILLAAGADRVTIQNCIAYSADAVGATNFIDLDSGVQNGTRILNNWIYGEYAEGAIHSDDIDLDIDVRGNTVYNLTSGQHGIEFTAAALGTYGNNYVYTDAEGTSIDPGSLKAVAPNWVVTAIDVSPVMFPAPDDTAQNFIGVDDNNNAVATTNVVPNGDGSILERAEALAAAAEPTYNHPNYFTVTLDGTSATWNTVATHEIVTVTGAVRLRILAECTEALTGATATIELGTANNTAEIIAQTTGTDIDATEIWRNATPDVEVVAGNVGITDAVVVGGTDVGYTIGTAALTDGTIIFHVWWYPLDSTGAAAAGAGGAL